MTLRIAAWNLERCKHVEASAALLSRAGADICLLSEMDYGMARSGNRHTTRDLAEALSAKFAYALEFVELGLGSPQEEEVLAGKTNSHGFHGNAILSRLEFEKPVLIRLDDGGAWFSLDWHHPRLGGRIALAATIVAGGRRLVVVSAHLENLETPEGRACQVQRLLRHLAIYAANGPVIVAGDFNTAALPEPHHADGRDPGWFLRPEKHEPLFSHFKAAGFGWVQANTPEQTRRILDDGRRPPLPRRIDWFFVRDVKVSNPMTWNAVDTEHQPLSDHELITLDVELD